MARGKHGQIAETRKAFREAEDKIDTYQHAVQRLTAENRELKAQVKQMQQDHWRDIKHLKAQRDEGLSPAVIALQEETRRLKDEAEAAVRYARGVKKAWLRVSARMDKYLIERCGLSPEDSHSVMKGWMGTMEGIDFDYADKRLLRGAEKRL